MNTIYRGTIAACGLVLAASVASAADMRVARPVAQVYDSPIYNWTGFYAGAFVGGSHGVWSVDFFRNNNHGSASEGADGAAFGVWGGYNFQLSNHIVVGAEMDLGKSSASQTNNIFDNDTSRSEYGMFGSARGRVGYAFDRLLVFGTFGVGFANISNDIQKGRNAGEQIVWDDQFRTGFVVGGGAEYAFTNNLIGRGEYLYTDYGSATLYNADGNRAEFKNEMHLLRAGLSYRF
jgi:outer membrane immunogenic protein